MLYGAAVAVPHKMNTAAGRGAGRIVADAIALKKDELELGLCETKEATQCVLCYIYICYVLLHVICYIADSSRSYVI
jgi:hypothetical protein